MFDVQLDAVEDCRVKGNLITRSSHVGVRLSGNEWTLVMSVRVTSGVYEKYVCVYVQCTKNMNCCFNLFSFVLINL